ncbi:MAG: D-alanyl-D-alanine carboxypeptidase family protein [Bacillota bacterium]|nr:D-alanyl-D-alanine carboxypeptidase family protein [Bacillota bacterium]
MKKSRFIPLILIFCLILMLFCPAALAETTESIDQYSDTHPYVSSKYALVADMDTGRVLYEKGGYEQHPPASITKIMTALLCIEAIERGELNLDDSITAPDDCREGVPDEASTAHIVGGEIMSLEDILYCTLLPSANEACNIIAVLLADSRESFVNMMNERAAQIGCTSTHFSNPNGISNDNHYTTAYDLFLIARECMRHEIFSTIVGTVKHDIPATNKSEARHLTNSNALINVESFYGDHYVYPGCYGVKTGHTELAGYNLVTCVERNGMNLMVVVFGGYAYGTGFSNFTDSVNLYDWAFNEYRSEKLLDKGVVMGTVAIEGSKSGETVELVTMDDVCAACASNMSVSDLQQAVRIFRSSVSAPVEKGAVLGEVSYTDAEGNIFASTPLVAAESVDSRGFSLGSGNGLFSHVWVWIVLIILLLAAGFFGYMYISYKKHNAKLAKRRHGAHEVKKNEKA